MPTMYLPGTSLRLGRNRAGHPLCEHPADVIGDSAGADLPPLRDAHHDPKPM